MLPSWLRRPVPPRVLRLLTLLALSVLLLPLTPWFPLMLAPLAIHVLVGFERTSKREQCRAMLSPKCFALPFVLSLWIRSHWYMSYYLLSIGSMQFLGCYIFPGVIEVGVYEHDPAGIKYLQEGVTPEIADVMTDTVQRFQTFDGSSQVFDGVCFWRSPISPMDTLCREVPIIAGWGGWGTIFAGLHPDGWTPASFYTYSGPWVGTAYRSTHLGFHFIVPTLLAAVVFARGILHWRRHERRLRKGLCPGCGYDLTGNESGICPECGRPTGAT